MTIVNQTITLAPTGGGTANATPKNSAWVKMSDTRMVFVYSQLTPFARRFLIVDNPDGLNSTTVPTTTEVTAFGENTTATFANAVTVHMAKINATTFMLVRKFPAEVTYGIEFFSIIDNVITKLRGYDYNFNTSASYTNPNNFYNKFQQGIALVSGAENEVFIHYTAVRLYSTSSSSMVTYIDTLKCTWNPDTTDVSFNTVDSSRLHSSRGGEGSTSGQVYSTFRFPSFSYAETWDHRTLVNLRLVERATGATSRSDSIRFSFYNKLGDLSDKTSDNGTGTWWTGTENYLDPLAISDTNIVYVDWDTYVRKPYSRQGNPADIEGGKLTLRSSPEPIANTMAFPLAVAPDYYIVLDSRYFMDTTKPLSLKVIRRDDPNIYMPSPGTSATYGVTIDPIVHIDCCWSHNRPFLLNQDVMWCGVQAGKTNVFAYNIIKQPN